MWGLNTRGDILRAKASSPAAQAAKPGFYVKFAGEAATAEAPLESRRLIIFCGRAHKNGSIQRNRKQLSVSTFERCIHWRCRSNGNRDGAERC